MNAGDRSAGGQGITLSEADGIRYLHFDSPWIQGAMRIARPSELVLDYTQQMMAWLLLREPPARLLQLGLGAGALTRFSLRHLPRTGVEVVERDPAVVAVARSAFRLPAMHRRLAVTLADAGEFVARPDEAGRYGVLQVDLYDRDAAGPVLDTMAFYRDCRALLDDAGGVLVVNLFGHRRVLRPSLTRLAAVFDRRLVVLPAVPAGNTVVLALHGPPLAVASDQVRARARVVAERYGLPAQQWLSGWLPDQGEWRI